jgi:hypothetical protein
MTFSPSQRGVLASPAFLLVTMMLSGWVSALGFNDIVPADIGSMNDTAELASERVARDIMSIVSAGKDSATARTAL